MVSHQLRGLQVLSTIASLTNNTVSKALQLRRKKSYHMPFCFLAKTSHNTIAIVTTPYIQYSLKQTETSTLNYTRYLHIQINMYSQLSPLLQHKLRVKRTSWQRRKTSTCGYPHCISQIRKDAPGAPLNLMRCSCILVCVQPATAQTITNELICWKRTILIIYCLLMLVFPFSCLHSPQQLAIHPEPGSDRGFCSCLVPAASL